MGYHLAYYITIKGMSPGQEREYQEDAERILGCTLEVGIAQLDGEKGGVKWYSNNEDASALSKLYPNLLIDIERYGEEPGDVWKTRFKNGEVEWVKAEFANIKESGIYDQER